jgi:hypothetical protein
MDQPNNGRGHVRPEGFEASQVCVLATGEQAVEPFEEHRVGGSEQRRVTMYVRPGTTCRGSVMPSLFGVVPRKLHADAEKFPPGPVRTEKITPGPVGTSCLC